MWQLLCLIFWGTARLFRRLYHFTVPVYECSNFPAASLALATIFLFDCSHPHGFERICLFIYISSVAHNAGHLFMCLLTIYVSSFQKCSFRYCMHFKIRLFVFIVELSEFLIYSRYCCLADVWFANILSHSLYYLTLYSYFYAVIRGIL